MSEISLTGDQMLAVLDVVARHGPVSAAEVAKVCGINRTVAYRLINTLWKRNYLRQTREGYALGQAVLRISRYLEQDVGRIARPFLCDLAGATGETAVLHCIDRDQAVVTAQALGEQHVVRVEHVPGSRHPLTSGASGWSLLAFQDDAFIARIIGKNEHAPVAWERISKTRQLGFALSHDELQYGVHGLAAPVLRSNGGCIASVAILVPTIRAAGLEQHLSQLLSVAKSISQSVGLEPEQCSSPSQAMMI